MNTRTARRRLHSALVRSPSVLFCPSPGNKTNTKQTNKNSASHCVRLACVTRSQPHLPALLGVSFVLPRFLPTQTCLWGAHYPVQFLPATRTNNVNNERGVFVFCWDNQHNNHAPDNQMLPFFPRIASTPHGRVTKCCTAQQQHQGPSGQISMQRQPPRRGVERYLLTPHHQRRGYGDKLSIGKLAT